jgi:hypothetical protein
MLFGSITDTAFLQVSRTVHGSSPNRRAAIP